MFMHSIECKYAPSSFENTWPKNNEWNNVNSGTQMTFFLLNLGLKEMSEHQNSKNIYQQNRETKNSAKIHFVIYQEEFLYILLPYIPVCSIISAAINVNLLFIIYYLGCLWYIKNTIFG